MIAYSSVSHMGVIVVGIATLNSYGLTGAMYQMVAHGLVAGALFMLIGLLYERTHTRNLNDYGALLSVTPVLPCCCFRPLPAASACPVPLVLSARCIP
ncbi:MAG: proton-conducting transporter membrane subunit [Thiolinea sp.]